MIPSSKLPTDLERATFTIEDERPVEVAPSKTPTTPGEWIRLNLFSSVFNGVLTVLSAAVVAFFGFQLVRWIFASADWGVVKANLRIYMVGRFPLEEVWRVWASAYLVAFLIGLSWGVSGLRLLWTPKRMAYRAVLTIVLLLVLAYLLEGLRIWILTLAIPAAFAAGVLLGRAGSRRLRGLLIAGWTLVFPAIIVLLRAFDGVPPEVWGGFMLNVLLAVAAIFLSFPVGILLALGRRSTLPVVSKFCVGFIELFRGVPLVTLIISGQFILPLMLPPGMRLSLIVRMILVFTIFSSAYVAEIVRGGLQGVHFGQYDAAKAVGLSTTRMMALIIMPQALRSTIPAMISHFISLFKDTSLLAALAITDALRAARRASAQLEFIGDQKEALLAAALLFWVVAFSMSRWSQRLERRLGVGER
ncbi:MAG TPA: amino acid ABC transporter permease [Actinomycetota bacterium]|nr:amino acid ABC transporter permease [Actinomycetota bacterium]